MLFQILATTLGQTNYPANLKGRYKARLVGVDYRDTAGTGQHFVLRARSNCFTILNGQYNNAILFTNQPSHGRTFDAPEVLIEAYGSIDLELAQVAGSGTIGNLDFCILTFDVEPLEA